VSKNSTLKVINQKKESRDIVKKILEFGVTEDQKIDIMINIALSLENNKNMKEIVTILKKMTINFNVDEKDNNINNDDDKNKILLN
tara:strand:+ start:274 stop:531 length:258 start_codon:yes stop_codon:yes gene_type:complete